MAAIAVLLLVGRAGPLGAADETSRAHLHVPVPVCALVLEELAAGHERWVAILAEAEAHTGPLAAAVRLCFEGD